MVLLPVLPSYFVATSQLLSSSYLCPCNYESTINTHLCSLYYDLMAVVFFLILCTLYVLGKYSLIMVCLIRSKICIL